MQMQKRKTPLQNELKDRRIFYEAVSETYFSAGGCSDGRRADAGAPGLIKDYKVYVRKSDFTY